MKTGIPCVLALLLLAGGCDQQPARPAPVAAPAPIAAPQVPAKPSVESRPVKAPSAPARRNPPADPAPRAPLDLSLPGDPASAVGEGEVLSESPLLPPLFEQTGPASPVQLGGRLIPDERQEALEGAEISIEIKR